MDMDNDNDTDVIAIGYTSDEIAWFENRLHDPNHLIWPECVVYDYDHERYLVSAAGKGCIVELDTAGNQTLFYTATQVPLGMVISNNVLYISDDEDTLRGINLDTREEVMKLKLPATYSIDGLAADSNGYIYVVDTRGRIFKVNPVTQSYNVFVYSGELPMYLQDIVYDHFNNRLVAAAYQENVSIYSISLEDSTVTELVSNTLGYYDGITMDHDGYFYLASHNGGKILKYDPDFNEDPEIISTGHVEPAGLNYNTHDHMLAIPNFGGNSVDFIFLGPTAVDEYLKNQTNIIINPNPCSGTAHLRFTVHDSQFTLVDLYTVTGKWICRLMEEEKAPGDYVLEFDVENLSEGVYIVRIQVGSVIETQKIVVK